MHIREGSKEKQLVEMNIIYMAGEVNKKLSMCAHI